MNKVEKVETERQTRTAAERAAEEWYREIEATVSIFAKPQYRQSYEDGVQELASHIQRIVADPLESQLSAAREALKSVRPLFVELWQIAVNTCGDEISEACEIQLKKIDAALKGTHDTN